MASLVRPARTPHGAAPAPRAAGAVRPAAAAPRRPLRGAAAAAGEPQPQRGDGQPQQQQAQQEQLQALQQQEQQQGQQGQQQLQALQQQGGQPAERPLPPGYDPAAAAGFAPAPGEQPMWWVSKFEARRRQLAEEAAAAAAAAGAPGERDAAARAPPAPPGLAAVGRAALQAAQLAAAVAALILWPAALVPGGLGVGRVWALFATYLLFFSGSVRRVVKHGPLAPRARDAQGRRPADRAAWALFVAAVPVIHWPPLRAFLQARAGGGCAGPPTLYDAVGAALLVGALALNWAAARALGAAYDRVVAPEALVTAGPYAWVQHPVYVSYALLFTGYAMTLHAALTALFALAACAAYYGRRAALEAEVLAERFGADRHDELGASGMASAAAAPGLRALLEAALGPAVPRPEPGSPDLEPGELRHNGEEHQAAAADEAAGGGDAAALAAKLRDIKQRFDADAAAAADARVRLAADQAGAQRREAEALAAADAAFTPAWRAAGLPAKPPPLRDAEPVGPPAPGLVDARALLAAAAERQAREVLRPPAAAARAAGAGPHHLASTSSLQVRRAIAAERIAVLRAAKQSPAGAVDLGRTSPARRSVPWRSLPPDEAAARAAAAAARRQATAARMSAEQREAEERIIQALLNRLSFLCNPARGAPRGARGARRQRGAARAASRGGGGAGAPGSPRGAGFQLLPACGAVFSTYEPGDVCTTTVALQNVGSVMRGLRLLPPASRFFEVSLLRFPLPANELAPGMAAEVLVNFTPDTRGEYADTFAVETPAGAFTVPLRAARPRPALSLPAALQAGEVLLGNRRTRTVRLVNAGGAGRFLVLSAEAWAAVEAADRAAPAGSDDNDSAGPPRAIAAVAAAAAEGAGSGAGAGAAVSGAFSITPALLDLPAGRGASFELTFAPEAAGPACGDFVLVCDNCTRTRLAVEGAGASVDVAAAALDGRPATAADWRAPLWFGQVHPGCSWRRTVTVRNATRLPFPFVWQLEAAAGAQQQQPGAPGSRDAFAVRPAAGVLQPGSELEFALKFAPPRVAEHAARALLLVERSGDAAPSVIDTAEPGGGGGGGGGLSCGSPGAEQPPTVPGGERGWERVLELGLEGAGVAIGLRLEPSGRLAPQALTVGEAAQQFVALHNDSPAPAHFAISELRCGGGDGGQAAMLEAAPSRGTVPPHGALQLAVTCTALAAGSADACLAVRVAHGPSLGLCAHAEVAEPAVVPDVPLLDCGSVCLGSSSASASLHLTNVASGCSADWRVQQLGNQPACPLALAPRAGRLCPGGVAEVRVSVVGACEGSHRLLLSVASRSASGAARAGLAQQVRYVQVCVTVVAPRVLMSAYKLHLDGACAPFVGVPQRQELTVTNASRLPLDFSWSVSPHAPPGGGEQAGVLVLRIVPAAGRLAPSESCRLELLLEPRAPGPAALLARCHVAGMHSPAGFLVSGVVEGLRVRCTIQRPPQQLLALPATGQEPGCSAAGASGGAPAVVGRRPAPLVADFGTVALHEPAELLLRVSNETSIASHVRAWLGRLSAAEAGPAGATGGRSGGGGLPAGTLPATPAPAAPRGGCSSPQQRVASPQRASSRRPGRASSGLAARLALALTCSGDGRDGGGGAASWAGSCSSLGESLGGGPPVEQPSGAGGAAGPFHAAAGNAMLAARQVAADAAAALGGGRRGAAVDVRPRSAALPGWGGAELRLVAFNDLPGTYVDTLHVQAGDLPVQAIPLRLAVAGSPLALSRERAALPGLAALAAAQGRAGGGGWAGAAEQCTLDLGTLPAGTPHERSFYVHNRGALPVLLAWECCAAPAPPAVAAPPAAAGAAAGGDVSLLAG
ncbi:DLEC1 [Scenedesmus sp. PABB004]|nr:DLEC1 [Scenedesmus sp. PABB004]